MPTSLRGRFRPTAVSISPGPAIHRVPARAPALPQLYGKPVDPADIKLRIKMAEIGMGTRVELIQPLGGGPWRDFLETKGNGFHHLAFVTDDVTREGANLVAQGAIVLYKVRYQGGGGAIYLDTSKFGGIVSVIQFVSWPPRMTLD